MDVGGFVSPSAEFLSRVSFKCFVGLPLSSSEVCFLFLGLEIGAFCYNIRRTILQLGMFFGFTWARLLNA